MELLETSSLNRNSSDGNKNVWLYTFSPLWSSVPFKGTTDWLHIGPPVENCFRNNINIADCGDCAKAFDQFCF